MARSGGPSQPDTVKAALSAHLEFFAELGVDGIRREPEWRTRAERTTPPAGTTAAEPPDGPGVDAVDGAVTGSDCTFRTPPRG